MIKRVYKVLRNFPWLPLVCLGAAWLLARTETLQDLEWRSLDWRTQFRTHFQGRPDPRIAIILYSDDTDSNLVAWPPDRAYHGTLSELLSLAGPKVITWDVILDASREGDGDNAMGRGVTAAFANGTAVVTGSVTNTEPVDIAGPKTSPTRPFTQVEGSINEIFGDKFAIVPFPQLRAAGLYGFVDAPPGVDGIVRQIPLVVRIGHQVFPSLSLQTVMAYYHLKPKEVRVVPGDAVYLPTPAGVTRVPITKQGMYLVNYRYDQDLRFKLEAGQQAATKTGQSDFRLDYPTDEYGGVLLKLNAHFVEQKANVALPDYHGKIVLIGQYVTGKADGGPTSLSSYSPLVLIHANVVNNILDRDFVRPVPAWLIWTALLVLGYLSVYTARHGSLIVMCAYGLLVAVAYTNLVFWGWIQWSLHLPLVAPMIGFVTLEFIVIGRRVWHEQRAKQAIKGMFGSYVSPAVVDRLV
ncbi:MAG: CHASE2 domain-containing protein, partial [Opitutales bacterium]